VIYNYDDEYEKSYKTLKKEQKDLGRNVDFVNEKLKNKNRPNFSSILLEIILNKKYEFVMFLVDDNIFTGKFNLSQIKDLIRYNLYLGFSLRLGTNTKYCYSMNSIQKVPESKVYVSQIELNFLKELYPTAFAFDWTNAEYDFAYPLEISSSVYKIDLIKAILTHTEYKNPNDLEANMYSSLPYFVLYPKLLSYETSVAFCAPMNKVQDTAPNNRFSGINIYSPRNMLKMHENGFRVDWKKFDGFISNACHQEVGLYTLEEFKEYDS